MSSPSSILSKKKLKRPISPGHVLLIPTRVVKKFKDLYESEAMELFVSSKKIGEALKVFYKTDSVQYSIQDGEDAGFI